MKIIQVYQSSPFENSQGGGVRYVKNLVDGINNQGTKVLFLGVGKEKKSEGLLSFIPITGKQSGYIMFLLRLFVILPFINTKDYTVVHVHRLYFAIPFLLFKPKLKIVCSLHGRTFSVFESNYGSSMLRLVKPLFMFIERFTIKNIDQLIPVSQDVLNSFKKKYPRLMKDRQKDIKILGSMLELADFKVSSSTIFQDRYGYENRYLLFIGRMADVKDIPFLLRFFGKHYDRNSKIKLVVVGSGELLTNLKKLSKNLCPNNPPIFFGEANPKLIPKLISSAAMTLLTSKHEASPTVIKESLSCGTPVVTAEVGDVKDFIVDNVNGYVVSKNTTEYFKATQSILKSPNQFSKSNVYVASEENLRKTSIEYISSCYIKIYEN